MLSPYYARVRSEIERFGGTVEKFIGDAVMAVFGAPVSHEDDPERAVRAALAVREAVQELNEANPALDLHVRIAVNTGEAVVALDARPARGRGHGRRRRRQHGRPPAGGRAGGRHPRRRGDVPGDRAVVEYRDVRAGRGEGEGRADPGVGSARGARPLRRRRRPARTAPSSSGARRSSTGSSTRSRALERERTPQLVTLVGVPGIGKSRLVWELARAVDADPDRIVFWRQGRSLPYGEGVAFWALAEMVKAQAGILETDSRGGRRGEARATLVGSRPRRERGALGRDASCGRWSGWRGGGGRRRPTRRGVRRVAALLRGARRAASAVLVFEDLHWADDNLLDFVDYLVDWASGRRRFSSSARRGPSCSSDGPAGAEGSSNADHRRRSRRSPSEETARLIASLLEEPVMPAEKQAPLLARAGGNPLYAEEYARMVAERGVALTDEAPLPETVQGIIAARLDALSRRGEGAPPGCGGHRQGVLERRARRDDGLQRWTVEESLHGLERKEFVRRERRSSVATETEYAFRHVLVRDVAYGQVPRAAAGREASPRRRMDRDARRRPRGPRGDARPPLRERARVRPGFRPGRWTRLPTGRESRSSRRASARTGSHAYASAAGFYRDAVELWPPGEPGGGRLLFRYARSVDLSDSAVDALPLLEEARDLLLAEDEREVAAEAEIALGQYHWFRADRASATPREEQAAVLIEGVEPSRAKAFVLSELSRFAMLRDEDARAVDLAGRALAMAEEFGADEVRARALNILGVSTVKLGDRRGLADVERSIEIAAEIGSPEVLRGYINLASTLGELGELERSSELHAKGLKRSGADRGARAGAVAARRANLGRLLAGPVERSGGSGGCVPVECRGGSFAIHGDCCAAHSRPHTVCARRQRGGVGRLGRRPGCCPGGGGSPGTHSGARVSQSHTPCDRSAERTRARFSTS